MNTTPIGRMATQNAFIAPVVVAASASCPSDAHMNASQKPITACVERASTIGHASDSSVPSRAGPTGADTSDDDDTGSGSLARDHLPREHPAGVAGLVARGAWAGAQIGG